MTEQKSSKGDDGRGQPPTAEAKTTEPQVKDPRLIPGGSFSAAARPQGVSAMDHYEDRPGPKADLPDLSDIPGWNIFPKTESR